MNGKIMNRVLMYISAMEMKEYQGEFHEKCKQIIGMRKLHQVLTKPGKQGIYLHRFAFMCSNCICGNVKSCDISKENPVFFNNYKDQVTPKWHDFEKVELTSYDNTTNSDEGSDEGDCIESFATTVIKEGVKCNYLELFQESKGGDVYYIEEKTVALVSAYMP